MWYDTFDSFFFITISAAVVGIFSLIIKSCYKSKCKDFSCCFGMIKIQRDTDIEQEIDTRVNRSDTIPNQI
jgi:hypothetical protein